MKKAMGRELGQRVRERREELGISRIDLAVLAGVSQNFLYLLEKGATASPTAGRLERLERALELAPGSLRGEDKETPPAGE